MDGSMTWRERASDFDADTIRVLEIAVDFLVRYFNHSRESAEHMMADFLETYGDRYDEDLIHHQSSYRVAATVHFVAGLEGSIDDAATWMVKEGHNNPPREALEYFREHYFEQD